MDPYSYPQQESLHYYTLGTSQSCSGGVWSALVSSKAEGSYSPFSNTRNGNRNPQWRSQIRNQVDATTPFSGNKLILLKRNPVHVYALHVQEAGGNPNTQQGSLYSVLGFLAYPSVFKPNAQSDVKNRVINRCISKFLDACDTVRSSIEAGQDIGEYRETMESIHRPLNSMRLKLNDYFNQLSKAGRRAKGPKLLKVVSDTYLEFRFGINPLVDDVAQVIADCGRYRFPTYPVKAKAHERYNGSSGLTTAGGTLSYPGNTIQAQNYSEFRCRYKGVYRSGSGISGQIPWTQSLRLLPSDFVSTVWDLLPYSWMVDYFTNVGDVYRGLSFIRSNLAWGCKTLHDKNHYSYSSLIPYKFGLSTNFAWVNNVDTVTGGDASFETVTFTRSQIDGFDLIPRFQVQIPQSKYPYLNMMAVFVPRFKALSRLFTSK